MNEAVPPVLGAAGELGIVLGWVGDPSNKLSMNEAVPLDDPGCAVGCAAGCGCGCVLPTG